MLTSDNYDEIERLGISIFGPSKEESIQSLNDYFPHADLYGLIHQLVQIGDSYDSRCDGNWLVMEYTTNGSVIEINYMALSLLGYIEFCNSLFRDIYDVTAYLSYISIPIELQKQNVSRKLYGSLYQHFSSLGVKRMALHATLTAGGYVWARVGFAAREKAEVIDILDSAISKLKSNKALFITQDDVDFMQNMFDIHYLHTPHLPFPIYLWALDCNLGQEILVDTEWNGVLDLDNESQVAIFRTYINSRP